MCFEGVPRPTEYEVLIDGSITAAPSLHGMGAILRARCLTYVLVLASTGMLVAAGHRSGNNGAAQATAGNVAAIPATLDDLPKLGVNGLPVLTVDGRVCRFPWTGPSGARHTNCATLSATDSDDTRLWCKDVNDLWGICAAPKASSSKHGNKSAGVSQQSQVPTAGEGTTSPATVLSASTPGACFLGGMRAPRCAVERTHGHTYLGTSEKHLTHGLASRAQVPHPRQMLACCLWRPIHAVQRLQTTDCLLWQSAMHAQHLLLLQCHCQLPCLQWLRHPCRC